MTKKSSQRSAVIRGVGGKQYKVKVRAYKTVDGKKVYGSYSNVVKATVMRVKVPHESWS